jgi:hypothetical protein
MENHMQAQGVWWPRSKGPEVTGPSAEGAMVLPEAHGHDEAMARLAGTEEP